MFLSKSRLFLFLTLLLLWLFSYLFILRLENKIIWISSANGNIFFAYDPYTEFAWDFDFQVERVQKPYWGLLWPSFGDVLGYTDVVIPFWLLLVLLTLLSLALSFWKKHKRRKRGLCVKCGYDLRGNNTGACPECGKAVSHVIPPRVDEKDCTSAARAPRLRVKWILVSMIIGTFFSLAYYYRYTTFEFCTHCGRIREQETLLGFIPWRSQVVDSELSNTLTENGISSENDHHHWTTRIDGEACSFDSISLLRLSESHELTSFIKFFVQTENIEEAKSMCLKFLDPQYSCELLLMLTVTWPRDDITSEAEFTQWWKQHEKYFRDMVKVIAEENRRSPSDLGWHEKSTKYQ